MIDDEKLQNAFKGLFMIQEELLKALEWVVRDGADMDDCAKARPHVEKAREYVEMAKAHSEGYAS